MPSATTTTRSAQLGLRATPEQETVLRRAVEVAHKPLADFIPDAAYQAAEQALLDQHLFLVSGASTRRCWTSWSGPGRSPSLEDLLSRRSPWAER